VEENLIRTVNQRLVEYRAAVRAGDSNAARDALERLEEARRQRQNMGEQMENIVPVAVEDDS
jgi:hypothetical protein